MSGSDEVTQLAQRCLELWERYRSSGRLDVLDELVESALRGTRASRDVPDAEQGFLENLNVALSLALRSGRVPADLPEIVEELRLATTQSVRVGAVEPRIFGGFQAALLAMADARPGLSLPLLEEAVASARVVGRATSFSDAIAHGIALANLALLLHSRYRATGNGGDLSLALAEVRRSLELLTVHDEHRAKALSVAAFVIADLAAADQPGADLDEGIAYVRESLDGVAWGSVFERARLNLLATMQELRSQQLLGTPPGGASSAPDRERSDAARLPDEFRGSRVGSPPEGRGGPTVVIVDDHPAIIDGVRGWCTAADPPVAVVDSGNRPAVAFAGAGRDADVVVFDLLYGAQPDFGSLRRLIGAGRRVVVFSQEDSADTMLRCVEMGAATYLTKTEGDEHLVPAIRAIAAGGTYTGPLLSGVLAGDRRPGRPVLSEREREVLIAWFECESKQLVARKLHISVKTVDTHIERVRMKYADTGRPATSKSALMIRALQDGIVDLADLADPVDE